MTDFEFKRIADPVHGTVGLSELETRLIHCRAYQRLRGVKQLGVAHFVFPGADYSRFAHSIGVCHVTGRLTKALLRHGLFKGGDIDRETQKYRLAALCHDLGHYPFSHAMEEAVRDHYSAQLETGSSGVAESSLHHEEVSEQVLVHDDELRNVLSGGGFTADDLAAVFRRKNPPPFANLISSDLDADRIDYLLRTALHTGLPYGNVDLDYIVSQMRLDNEGRLALVSKALRSAEHLLLCRFFDYQTVSFHKTVAALELLLKDVLRGLLTAGTLDCSASTITTRLKDGSWAEFDDAVVMMEVRKLAKTTRNATLGVKANALLRRNVPKLCGEIEWFGNRNEADDFKKRLKAVRGEVGKWATAAGVSPDFLYVWDQKVLLTKAGTAIPFTAVNDIDDEEDKHDQSVRVMDRSGNSESIVDDDDDQGELDATAGRRGDEEQDAQEQPARRGYLNRCTQDSSPIWLLAPSTGVFRKGVAACRPNDEQRARIVAREPAS